MPYFIRTRRLDINRLEKKPQENLEVVHAILIAAVKDLEEKIRRVERNFYGFKKGPLDEVRKWVEPVKKIIDVVHMGQITAAWQLEEIIKELSEPTTRFKFDMFQFNKVKESYRKIRDAVPSRFLDILVDAKTILKYLIKYCLSFYSKGGDLEYETADHYETKRMELCKFIRNLLDDVLMRAEKFRSDKRGLWVSDLSPYGIDLARRANCATASYLALFPDCCDSIKLAVKAMKEWIELDSSYSVFIKNDVEDFEKKKDESLKMVRELQTKYHQMGFRLKQHDAQYEKLEKDIGKLNDREDDLMILEEELKSETNEIQVHIEMKEYGRDEMIKNSSNLHRSIFFERLNELSESLRDLKRRLPNARRELGAVRHKLSWVTGKQAEHRQLGRKLKEMRQEMESLEQQRLEQEVLHEDLTKQIEMAKRILLYKSCPDSMEKIFNERPVEVNKTRLPGNKSVDDPFERTCVIVANHIDNDWPKLYRVLPFFPARGSSTTDQDILEITNTTTRMGSFDIAMKCLYRWRRFHTRAKQEDLKEGLAMIHRYDILEKINLELDPPQEDVEEEEEPITYVEAYLVPFVRQVERFDALRAANKI